MLERFYCLPGFFISKAISFVPSFRIVNCLLGTFKTVNVSISATIHSNVRFLVLKNIKIGSGSTINSDCFIDSRCGVEIGSNVMIGRKTSIYTLGHDPHSINFSSVGSKVKICDDVVIFPHSLIMPGVIIGKGSVVYPGSVITKSVEPYTIVGGNPAVVKGSRNNHINYSINYKMYKGV